MVNQKRKYESGAATNYVSRNECLKKLQLSLKDFRRLCILKGIHPHEPAHKKKVNKGSTENKTWYYEKDIAFLAHEPLIKKFREHKHFIRKLRKAEAKREPERAERIRLNKPVFTVDHIVKERYPTFTDAISDVDDALCSCFLFTRLPKSGSSKVTSEAVQLCGRLTTEFMNYVIATKALRKVFISIKGIYYQVQIQGLDVTWVVPHLRGNQPVTEVDFSVMATFVQFYCSLLGFVNFRLFQLMGLRYPPKPGLLLDDAQCQLPSLESQPGSSLDDFSSQDVGSEQYAKAKAEQDSLNKLKTLFSSCKFFLNREVPVESTAFVIRSCGGQVSWDESSYPDPAPYGPEDETVTHHVIDRPTVTNQKLSRWYIQPQWVYDCVNARALLPVKEYFPGSMLPPHLSPFVEERLGDYVPQASQEPHAAETTAEETTATTPDNSSEEPVEKKSRKKQRKENAEIAQPAVRTGKLKKVHPQQLINKSAEDQKLREMMVPKRYRNAYKKMKFGENRKRKEVRVLEEKRKQISGT